MIAAFAREKRPATATGIPAPARTKARKGSGFGELVDVDEGRRRLASYVTEGSLEGWAGPVAGSTMLRERGIARSTLHDWQKRGEVIALLSGARKHAFPLAKFVDDRPVQGISDVLEISGTPRRAWVWIVQIGGAA